MKILWIDLNSSYAHSSLALPALHAQIANDPSIEWAIVSATINENAGTVVLSRTDVVDAAKVQQDVELIREHNASASIVTS